MFNGRKILAWSKSNWVIVFAIIWFVVGFALLGTYKLWDWRVLTGFATWVLAGGVIVAIRQIYETRKSTNAQLAVELFRELRSTGSKDTLHLVYRLRPEDLKRLHENTNIGIKNIKNEINSLLDKFEMLGSLVNHRIIDKPLAIKAFGGAPALRCWYKLVEYIRKETCKRGYFLQNYEAFTRLCLDYFNKEQVKVKFYKEDSSEPPEDLLQFSGDLVQFFGSLKKEDERYPRSLEEIKRDRKNKARAEKTKK